VAFEHELQVYRAHLEELLGPGDVHEGKYTAIKGDVVAGVYPTLDDALRAGYDRFGLDEWLCKKIERVETIYFFSWPI
jgi:hypothetical protein